MSTRKLAKELGLLRRHSESSHGRRRPVRSNQIFSYLIVIDFESTCWRERNALSQEIIEFPAVLLNTSTGAVESEFHTYVQPQEQPILSDFCTELTGITQTQVERGIPLHICLSRFTRWLQSLQLNMGVTFPSQTCSAPSAAHKPCTFLTWSDWDLGVCLQYECKRKQLHKPAELNSWIDLRSTYRMFYNKKPKGLNGALQDLGIQFEGREHSGLDDSRNTAQLAVRMMRDGCVMKITKSLGRTLPVAEPTSGPPAGDKKSGKCNTVTASTSSSGHPQTSGLVSKCTRSVSAKVDIKECQSLVSPKTLLNGTGKPLGLTATSPLGRCSLQHNGTHHFLPSSTTFSSLLRPLQHPAQTAAAEYWPLETDHRCGSYDDVVIEGGDDVTVDAEGQSRIASTDFDYFARQEPKNTLKGLITSEGRKRAGFEGTLTCQTASHDSVVTMKSRNVLVRGLADARQHSGIPGPGPVAVPGGVALHVSKNGRHYDACVKLAAKTHGAGESSKRTKPPNASVHVSPTLHFETLVTPRHCHRGAPRPPFKVFSDDHSRCSTSRTPRAPPNTLPTRGGTVAQRVTSPLCSCGRRAKRQLVSNGGPNHGRSFYCCPVRRPAGGGQVRKGCEFFKWESAVTPAVGSSSASFCHIASCRGFAPVQSSAQRKSL